MSETVMVPCPCCGGRGRVEFTGEYRLTLERLREQPGEVSGAELARIMGVRPTAMCNRLARLEAMGLATSRRFGRERRFRAKEAP